MAGGLLLIPGYLSILSIRPAALASVIRRAMYHKVIRLL